ncbi:hypothetical protein [Actinotalea sp. K2]|uniref:hypothetical protein n=1 Tax=Actinotalea sp. K2 TaxID=2939438 RepID=UPI0020170E05|nr:hypothetical protein [Actinotalea sp. K2]MCL3862479.1 hypothetical protein [Actinotalea sp. K2]
MDTASTTPTTLQQVENLAITHGRSVETVTADPNGLGLHDGRAVLVVDGQPEMRIALEADGNDSVTLEECYVLEVPRADVTAVVEAIWSGRARVHHGTGGPLAVMIGALLRNPTNAVLRVPVGTGHDQRVYQVDVPHTLSAWLSTVPVE